MDDDPQARDAYKYVIEDMGLQPCQVPGPLDDISAFIGSIEPKDVVLCDFHLKKKSYANCDGDQLTAQCFQAGVPSALCTTIEDAPIRRDCLRYIPGLLDTGTPDPSELQYGVAKMCSGARRSLRALPARVAHIGAYSRYRLRSQHASTLSYLHGTSTGRCGSKMTTFHRRSEN